MVWNLIGVDPAQAGPAALLVAGGLGLVAGAIFFLGLWWTIRLGIGRPMAGLWFMGSLAARLVLAIALLWPVIEGHWLLALSWLSCFLLVRLVLTKILGPGHPQISVKRP
ncbi:MAG: ATP synthase subunit I [Deltaproteobacteria bacterium]|nr:ATP synthase subunit I [Deltaproteobacteria bacterium]